MSTTSDGRRAWRFYRAGGVDQVLLAEAADVLALPELDQKLWVALSCPVKGLEFDERTLTLLDVDQDGRVRAAELLAAVKWLKAVLQDPTGLVLGADGVPLSVVSTTTPEGQAVLASARHMLEVLGKPGTLVVTVADAAEASARGAKARWNGDGVVPPASMPDDETRKAAEDLLSTVGGREDRSGQQGVTAESIAAFFTQLAAHAEWHAAAEAKAAEVLPLGAGTAAASAAVEAIAAKVDDWFVRCRVAAFDTRAHTAVNRSEQAYLDAAARDLSVTCAELRQLPLAHVEAGRALDLAGPVNPAWQAEVDALRTAAVEPLLGKASTSLTEVQWTALKARLAPYRGWATTRAGAAVEPLGLARVKALLAGNVRARLEQAVAEDLAAAPRIEAALQVERLARYWRDLFRLVNNFVSFSDFYARKKAVFQAGTLYLDARTTDLCVQVLDAAKHGTMAGKSGTYLVYAECSRPGCDKMTVACAMTAGDSDALFVGRNGVFYDRKGRDWDATITKIVENPISIRQAFWSPYKKLIRLIEEQVAKRAAAADSAANAKMAGAATAVANADQTKASTPPKPKFEVGTIAALGVAVGGITAALGALLQAFFGLGIWMPLGLLGIVILISGPSMVIAWLKLRQRNLGPLLDANGWAVNAKAKMNVPFGGSLTQVAKLPPGSHRDLSDPFEEPRSPWKTWVVVLAALGALWYFGAFEKLVPNVLPKSGYVERVEKQAGEAKAAASATNAPAPAATAP
ncbi:MAG: hypothetical protein VKS61_02255 [Candidatus Sericytochromatia bacterium]|nr:hypothetical protein [Candidatus Sericytochromatia bacterium]